MHYLMFVIQWYHSTSYMVVSNGVNLLFFYSMQYTVKTVASSYSKCDLS